MTSPCLSGLTAEAPCGTSQCVGSRGQSEVDYPAEEAQQWGGFTFMDV